MLCSWKMRQCFSTWTWNFFAAGLVLDWGFFGGEGMVWGDLGVFFVGLFLVLFLVLFFPRRPRYLLMDPVCFVLCGISSELSFSDTRAQCIH